MGDVLSFPHSEPSEPIPKRYMNDVFDDLKSKNVAVMLGVGISPEGEAVFSATTFDPVVLGKLSRLVEECIFCLSESVSEARIEEILKEKPDGDT